VVVVVEVGVAVEQAALVVVEQAKTAQQVQHPQERSIQAVAVEVAVVNLQPEVVVVLELFYCNTHLL
jgi:hypothetical protein